MVGKLKNICRWYVWSGSIYRSVWPWWSECQTHSVPSHASHDRLFLELSNIWLFISHRQNCNIVQFTARKANITKLLEEKSEYVLSKVTQKQEKPFETSDSHYYCCESLPAAASMHSDWGLQHVRCHCYRIQFVMPLHPGVEVKQSRGQDSDACVADSSGVARFFKRSLLTNFMGRETFDKKRWPVIDFHQHFFSLDAQSFNIHGKFNTYSLKKAGLPPSLHPSLPGYECHTIQVCAAPESGIRWEYFAYPWAKTDWCLWSFIVASAFPNSSLAAGKMPINGIFRAIIHSIFHISSPLCICKWYCYGFLSKLFTTPSELFLLAPIISCCFFRSKDNDGIHSVEWFIFKIFFVF